MFVVEFKDKVFQLRMQLNMSQETLARDLGVCYATVNRWEKGCNIPRPQQIFAFEKYCKDHNVVFTTSSINKGGIINE